MGSTYIQILTVLIQNIFLWIILGAILTWLFSIPERFISKIVKYGVIWATAPCFIFSKVYLHLEVEKIPTAIEYACACLAFVLLAWLISSSLARKLPKETNKGAFNLTCLIQNYGFMAFATVEELLGSSSLAEMFPFVVVGDFLMWSLGISLVSQAKKISFKNMISPPAVALVIAFIALTYEPDKLNHQPIWPIITFIASFNVPLALSTIGGLLFIIFKGIKFRSLFSKEVCLVLLHRNLLFPAISIAIISALFQNGNFKSFLYIEAIMPMAIMPVAIVAIYCNGHKPTGIACGLSHAISLFTIPVFILILISLGLMEATGLQ